MNTTGTAARPLPRLLEWLTVHGVEYEVHRHDPAVTARATARADGVDPRTFAKVVVVETDDGRRCLLVLDATDHVDMLKARHVLGATTVSLVDEPALAALAPDCELGAMPAVGALFGLPMYADYAVREDPIIDFNAGSHAFAVRVDREAWAEMTGVAYADLADRTAEGPAWLRS